MDTLQETTAAPADTIESLRTIVQALPDKKLWSKRFSQATKMYLFSVKYTPSFRSDYQIPANQLRTLLTMFFQLGSITQEQEQALSDLLSAADDAVIDGLKLSRGRKAFLYSLKHGQEERVFPKEKETVNIDFITLRRASVEIEGNLTWERYADSGQPEVLFELDGETYPAAGGQERTEHGMFLGEEVSRKIEFFVRLPLEALDRTHDIRVLVKRPPMDAVPSSIKLGSFTPLSKELRNSYYAKNGWILRCKHDHLSLTPGKATISDEARLLKELFTSGLLGAKKAVLARLTYHILKPLKRCPIWILMDRANVANDNAEVLLDYIMTQPNDGTKYYFMISKKTPDYARLKKKFNVVPYLSYRHKMLLLLSDLTISSQHFVENYNPFFTYNQPYRDLLQDVNFISLDHGVKKDDLADRLSRYKKNIKMLVCSGIPEYRSFLDERYGYADGQVVLTGLCRYDRLYDDSKNNKVIAIMPTWRKYLTQGIMDRSSGKMLLRNGFTESSYFKFYMGLLTSERLLEVLKKYGYELDFVAHPMLAPYVDLFKVQPPVKIWGDEVIHRDIYARASLLITDYSSVAFDFANLYKPIIYSQFDADDFWSAEGHRAKGYFDFERDGFGEVVSTLDATIDKIVEYIENGCVMAPVYRQRAESFFQYHDHNNCQRVLEAIRRTNEAPGGGGWVIGKLKRTYWRLRDRIVRHILTKWTGRAFRAPSERDILITCDMLLEENTSLQDGFELFKYVYGQDERALEPYYIINEGSEHYEQLRSVYGEHIVGYTERRYARSLLRLIRLFHHTRFICGGYMIMAALNIGIVEAVKKNPEVYYIFLQHGVNFFKEDFITAASYSSFNFDRIMVSNEYEKALFMRKGCFPPERIIENGLLRWDLLAADSAPAPDKTIFVYFTHRRYLRDMADISRSVYIQTITGLLRHPRLKALTQRYGYRVKVGVHHTVADRFGPDVLSGIEVVGDDEIAHVKKEAALLITDYSAMCFEMWFQYKPVIFLHVPDRADCLRYGHKTDLPDPYRGKEDLLPGRVESIDECLDRLERCLRDGPQPSGAELSIMERSFYHRSDLCARFYRHLLELRGEKKVLYHVPFRKKLSFARYSDLYAEGLSLPNNSHGRWIVKKRAVLGFYIPSVTRNVSITLTAAPLLARRQSKLSVDLYVNGHKAKTVRFTRRAEHVISLHVPKAWLEGSGYVKLGFRVHGCYRHDQIGAMDENDRRRISLNLKTLRIVQQRRGTAAKA